MKNINKFLLAVIPASFTAFLGGWLIFGIVFADYYASNTNEIAKAVLKDPPEMWAIVIANVSWALLITYV